MTTWRIAQVSVRCGGCGAWIAKGAPLTVVTIPEVARRKFRGVCCVGAAPDGLAEPAMTVMVRRQQQGTFAQVVEALDREPGADG